MNGYRRPSIDLFLRKLFSMVTLLLAACGSSPHPSALSVLPAGTPVLAFGNSITFGTGAHAQASYPARLTAHTGWKIHNAGIPGDTAEAARQRLAPALTESRARLVIVEIGGNDRLQQRPPAAIKEDIRHLIATIRQAGATPVLLAVPEFSLLATGSRLSDMPLYAELAQEEKVILIDSLLAAILSDPSLKDDPIHPNAAGYEILAAGIAQTLVRAGLLAAR